MKKLCTFSILLCITLLCFQCEKDVLPTGVFPKDNQVIPAKFANGLLLNWEAVQFRDNRKFSYRVQLYEIDSIANNEGNANYYFKDVLDQNISTTSIKTPQLQPEKFYVWKISTVDQEGNEYVIKDLSSFGFTQQIARSPTPMNPNDYCLHCSYEPSSLGTCTLTCVTLSNCDPGTVIHIATGSFSLLPNNNRDNSTNRMSIGTSNNYNGNCYDLDNGNITIACKYILTIPFDAHPLTNMDNLVLNIFEDQRPLSSTDVNIINYESKNNPSATWFKIDSNDYAPVCIDQKSYYQAVIFVRLSFKMNMDIRSFFKNYEVVIDLEPASNTIKHYVQGGKHFHDSSTIPNDCTQYTNGTYAYYRCLDEKENSPNGHQGQHIVIMDIPERVLCGYWNLSAPFPAPVPDGGGVTIFN